MSKLFFDHLIVMDEVDLYIKKATQTREEREELWGLVDEIIHHKVLDVILGRLPQEHHHEFLELFHARPHDEGLLDYLKDKVGQNIEEIIRQEIGDLSAELLETIRETKK